MRKCLVINCVNTDDKGHFWGRLCMPCFHTLVYGDNKLNSRAGLNVGRKQIFNIPARVYLFVQRFIFHNV
jgi:hypothetical protein